MRERPVWAQISDSEQENGAVAFMDKYLASTTTAHPTYHSAAYPTRKEWDDQRLADEEEYCMYCGCDHDFCKVLRNGRKESRQVFYLWGVVYD